MESNSTSNKNRVKSIRKHTEEMLSDLENRVTSLVAKLRLANGQQK